MCGITGFLIGRENDSEAILTQMLDEIRHRGPDNQGSFIDENVALGHRRLSIIDVSEKGNQPMVYENGKYALVFNGEVYNFQEIRDELEKDGHSFDSTSDTEVILHALVRYGLESALKKFNGMFAFCFYDRDKDKIHLVRDRMGVKPLYYFMGDSGLIFASELKSLHKHPSFRKEINGSALRSYLKYMYVPSPLTIFRDCYKLEPGSYLTYEISSGNSSISSYWEIDEQIKYETDLSYDQILDRTDELLHSSIKYRLISDVPLGVFLSGGIDSSLTAAIMAQHTSRVSTFTIGFNEKKYNEAEKAKAIAKHLNTDHHEFYCSVSEARDLIEEITNYFDEPFADSSCIPTILLSRFARSEVKVALSADGGDELFGGYNKYNKLHNLRHILFLQTMLRGMNWKTFNYLAWPIRYQLRDKVFGLIKSQNQQRLFGALSASIQDHFLDDLILDNTDLTSNEEDFQHSQDVLNAFMRFDLKNLLEGDILVKVDRSSMSTGLESREPLLDYRLVEWAMQIPSHQKFKNGQKSILKSLAGRYIDPELLNYPKQGFNVPMNEWLQGDLQHYFEEYLNPDKIEKQGIFNKNEVGRLIKGFHEGKVHVYKIWTLIAFQMWYNKWMQD